MQVPVYNLTGEVVKQIDIDDQVFAVPFNEGVVHQVLLAQRANARQGTASTKTRGEVTGSTRKLYRQKGTGYARAGSRRSPLRRGGGIIFGPQPRSYRQTLPKKVRRLALRCVLSAKTHEGKLKILEDMNLEEPKTKRMAQILKTFGVDSSALVITNEPENNVIKSARNLPRIKTMPASLINVLDVLSYKMLLITEPAVRRAERLWGQQPDQKGEEHASV